MNIRRSGYRNAPQNATAAVRQANPQQLSLFDL
jgi:hypothetical protein